MYTLLAILHVWAASPTSYGAFEIALSPGLTEAECTAANDRAQREGRNEMCEPDEQMARFVNFHGCQVNMRDWPAIHPETSVRLLCVR